MWWDKLDRKGKMEGRKGGRRGREKKREREVETQGKRVYGSSAQEPSKKAKDLGHMGAALITSSR